MKAKEKMKEMAKKVLDVLKKGWGATKKGLVAAWGAVVKFVEKVSPKVVKFLKKVLEKLAVLFEKGFMQSIKAKIILMGSVAILAAIIIGSSGMSSANKNEKGNRINEVITTISNLQYQNQIDELRYQYYVDEIYLDNLLADLKIMTEKATELKKIDRSYNDSVEQLMAAVAKCEENYNRIIELNKSRSFDEAEGLFAEILEISASLQGQFGGMFGTDWVEIPWNNANMNSNSSKVKVGGNPYVKVSYKGTLPAVGKRACICFRTGGSFKYNGSYYITNIKLTGADGTQKVDLNSVAGDVICNSGDAYVSHQVVDFGGTKAVKVNSNFTGTKSWEEVSMQVPVEQYDLHKYTTLQYDIYFEPTTGSFGYQYGGAVNGLYDFNKNLILLDDTIKQYSKLVVDGKDVTESLATIQTLFAEIKANIPAYSINASAIDTALSTLKQKEDLFNQLKGYDEEVLVIKAENAEQNAILSTVCSEIQQRVKADMEAVRTSTGAVIISVIVLATLALVAITFIISFSITNNVNSFKASLDEIADGKVYVRVKDNGKDEFSEFGASINVFLDTLQNTIEKLQKASAVLAESGNLLEEKANGTKGAAEVISVAIDGISKGAGEQVVDIESSSAQILKMKQNIGEIIDSMARLSETANDMNQKGNEANDIMQELSVSSDKTTEAFGMIAGQIRKTNDSVQKIQDAINLISSIAFQTNLLSLNASIEAARAGEAGRGFAVVASEIQKLAEQTNSSAGIINDIIASLSKESRETVKSINEVTAMIEEQKAKVAETKTKIVSVSDGITSTENEMQGVLQQTATCNKASEHIVDLMNSLSAIAEENAASTEQTATTMVDLNDATVSLADTAQELKRLSNTMEEDLSFFSLQEQVVDELE